MKIAGSPVVKTLTMSAKLKHEQTSGLGTRQTVRLATISAPIYRYSIS